MTPPRDLLPHEHYWHIQAWSAGGALLFGGFVIAPTGRDALREAQQRWPGCRLLLEGREVPSTTPSTTTTRSL